jgi:hypothetical protein
MCHLEVCHLEVCHLKVCHLEVCHLEMCHPRCVYRKSYNAICVKHNYIIVLSI